MGLTFTSASVYGQGTGLSLSQSYFGALTLGSLLLVCINHQAALASSNPVTDTIGNSYSFVVGAGSTGAGQSLYWAKNKTATTNTVTVTMASSTGIQFEILEATGQATSSPIDVGIANSWTGTAVSLGPITTSWTNETLFAFTEIYPPGFTHGTGWTDRSYSASADYVVSESKDQASAGTFTATGTAGTSQTGAGIIVGIKTTSSVSALSGGWLNMQHNFANKH